VHALLARIHDPATASALQAERAFLGALDGSCRTPIAGHATISGDRLTLIGQILSRDGQTTHSDVLTGPVADAAGIGRTLGRALKARGGPGFFATG
jgi:hydroxymethylbilane synthase